VQTSICVGFGVSACKQVLSQSILTTAEVDGGADFQTNSRLEQSKAATLTTTWSYNTGTDPWSAGKSSDVFLVPNLNVQFKEIHEVTWSNTTCGNAETKLKFALSSPDNKPALGFLSRYDIDNVEIPELTKIKNQSAKDMTDLSCNSEFNSGENATCATARSNKYATEAAIAAWTKFLGEHDNTTRLAAEGKLPKRLYLKDLNKANDAKEESDSKRHYSGLVTKQMLDSAVPLDKTGQADNNLANINTIKFDGGGSELRFELTKEVLEDHIDKFGPPEDNSRGKYSVTGAQDFENTILAFDFAIGVSMQQHSDWERHHTLGSTSSDHTTVGFVLSDPDCGDVFDVDVFVDP